MNPATFIFSFAVMALTASAAPITQEQSAEASERLRINIDGGDLLGQILNLVLDI